MVKWITASKWGYKNSLTTLGILPLTIYIKTNDILLLSKIKQGGYDVNQLKVPDLSQPVRGGNCVSDQQTKEGCGPAGFCRQNNPTSELVENRGTFI